MRTDDIPWTSVIPHSLAAAARPTRLRHNYFVFVFECLPNLIWELRGRSGFGRANEPENETKDLTYRRLPPLRSSFIIFSCALRFNSLSKLVGKHLRSPAIRLYFLFITRTRNVRRSRAPKTMSRREKERKNENLKIE